MPKLYITEYKSIVPLGGAYVSVVAQIAAEPGVDQSPVDFSGGVASSASFAAATTYIRVVCDAQCSVLFGTNPTATNSNKMLPALAPEYFGVTPGQKISVVSNP
jgi:hypothetical protein